MTLAVTCQGLLFPNLYVEDKINNRTSGNT